MVILIRGGERKADGMKIIILILKILRNGVLKMALIKEILWF